MKKKHVTLPRTYKPGKGHPTETLAYLNPAEHELIRQLTDGKAQRGPKGVRSYAVTTGTTTKSDNKGGAGTGQGGQGGPGGGSLSAPNRTAPSTGGSGVTGSKTGGASTQKPGAGGNSGVVDAKTVAKAAETAAQQRSTSLSKVAQAAQQNAKTVSNPVSLSGAMDNGYYHSFRDTLPGQNSPNTFDRTIRPTGMVNSNHVPVDKWSKNSRGVTFDPNELTAQAQKLYQGIVDTALRTNTPVDFFSGKAARSTGTMNHPTGNAMDLRVNDPVTGQPVGGVMQPIRQEKLIGKPYTQFARDVFDTVYQNPNAYSGIKETMRWGGNFGDVQKDWMHFDTRSHVGLSSQAQNFNREAANRAARGTIGGGTMLAGGSVPAPASVGGPQIAGPASSAAGEADRLARAQKAAAGLEAILKGAAPPQAVPAPQSIGALRQPYSGYGTSNVPQRQAQAIPAPDSIGMLSSPSVFAEDPRIGLQGPGYPAAAKRGTAGTYTQPYDRIASEVVTDPRVGMGVGGFPAAKPRGAAGTFTQPYDRISSEVVTDPRTSLTPLGGLPAAKPKDVKVAWNVPPMGGALPGQSAWGLGMWGTNRPLPKGPAATPGTIHSKTASAAPVATYDDSQPPTSGGIVSDLFNTASAKVGELKKKAEDAYVQAKPALEMAQKHPGLVQLGMKLMMGGGGNLPGSLGNPQDNSRMYGPAVQQASAAPVGMSQPANPLQYLLRIQQNMVAQGASPEDLAYIQSIIDELNSKVA